MSRICWWQPVLTPHQSHTLRSFARAMGQELRVISSASEIAIRKAQGWTNDGGPVLPVEILPDRGWRARIAEILREERASVHIFGSPFERSKQNLALILTLAQRYETYLVSEPYSPVATGYLADRVLWKEQLKVAIRPRLYSLYGQLLRKRLSGVFAISPAAVSQYRRMGIETGRVFPFGYFVPLEPVTAFAPPNDNRPLRAAYLGSFIRRKGVEVLLEAFISPEVRRTGATLTLFGAGGDPRVEQCGDHIRYYGSLPFGEVHHRLAEFDLLIVPSLYDGWAVVVNEAIGAGVPVLASDMVGAGAMLERWQCGACFASGDCTELSGLIAALSTDRRRLQHYRAQTRLLAEQLQPDVAGKYMSDCIDAVRAATALPLVPWY